MSHLVFGMAHLFIPTLQRFFATHIRTLNILLRCLPLIALLLPLRAQAEGYFQLSTNARLAYTRVLSLRFESARNTLQTMQQQEPDNLMACFIENYAECLEIFVDDNEAAYKSRKGNMDKRLRLLARGDHNSPWYWYAQAEVRLQWAILRGKYGDYLSALSDVKQAYSLLEQNHRLFPDFGPNRKSLGALHVLAGNVPENYRWAFRLLSGMEGDIEGGLAEVESALLYAQTREPVLADETRLLYALLQLHIGNQPDKAWKTLQTGALKPAENPLAAFVMANVAMKTGRNDEAIRLIEACPESPAYHPFYYKHYMLGLARLYRLDPDAGQSLQYFVNHFPGKMAIKEAYQKLAWHHLVSGNETGYRTYMQYVLLKGSERSEPDKAAQKEAENGIPPDPLLTRARLLFDGGYYRRAHDLLAGQWKTYAARDKKTRIEYAYRMGRIAHQLGNNTEAEQYYRQTIEQAAGEPWYFACNAALQLGLLFEQSGRPETARTAYRQCLKIEPDEYADSLHARAKAGLKRLKK